MQNSITVLSQGLLTLVIGINKATQFGRNVREGLIREKNKLIDLIKKIIETCKQCLVKQPGLEVPLTL